MSQLKLSLGIYFSETFICVSANQSGKNIKSTIFNDNQAYSHRIQPIISYNKETSEMKFGSNTINDDKFTTICDFIYLLGKRDNEIDDDYIAQCSHNLVLKDGYIAYDILYDNQQKVISPKEMCSSLIEYICSKTLVSLDVKEQEVLKKNIKVVIALPSTYSLTQKDAIIQATQLAGYDNIDIITDSSASILSCICNKKINISQGNILSFHLERSSFYISLIQVNNEEISLSDTIYKKDFGSNQITKTLYDYIINNIKETKRINIYDKNTQKEIYKACEKSINTLSSQDKCDIIIKSLHYNTTIDKAQFNSICNQRISYITNTFKDLTLQNNIKDINSIVLCEEYNRISNLDELIGKIYSNGKVYRSEEPYILYSEGSCIYSNYYQNKSFKYRIDDSKISKSKSLIIDIGNNYCFGYYYNQEDNEKNTISKDEIDLFRSIVAYNNINSERKVGIKPSSLDKTAYTIIKKPMNFLGMKKSDINESEIIEENYEVIADIDNNCMFKVNYNCMEKYYYPTQIISLLLNNMKEAAIKRIDIYEYLPVVMAVPIELNFIQKNEIHKAASESGLKILSLLQEPVCSLIAYTENENETENSINDENCNVLVFHLCNDSCKVTIMNKNNKNITILYTLGDKTVGGTNIVNKIYEYVITHISLKGNYISQIERINIRQDLKNKIKNKNFDFEFRRNNIKIYEKKNLSDIICILCKEELSKIMAVLTNAIQNSGITDIKYIILVGRASRYNFIKDQIKKEITKIFTHPYPKILDEINEYKIIIDGALKFSQLNKNNNSLKYVIRDVLPRSINVTLKHTNKQSLSYGIDLGTTLSSAACVKESGKIEILDTNTGTSTHQLPSCVSYSKDSDRIMVGEPAKNSINTNKFSLLYDSKRYIGKECSNISEEYTTSCLYEIVNENGLPAYKVVFNNQDTTIAPHIVSSKILAYINKIFVPQISCNDIPRNEIQVVIGVPAIFTDQQKKDTIKAAREVGFNNIILIPEPSAAALAYIYSHDKMKEKDESYFLVYDFGGGTFDVSIVHLKGKNINIIATHGDNNLGGQDITKIVEDYVTEKMINEKYVTEISDKLKRRIHKECEELKIDLSNNEVVDVDIGISEDVEYNFEISRSFFDNLCKHIYNKTIDITLLALDKAKFAPQNIDYVIMSGGSSKIPTLKNLITQRFDKSIIFDDVNSNEVVAIGCAIYAESINNSKYNKYIIEDKPFTSVSDETIVVDNISIFKRCTTLPCQKTETLIVDKGVIKVEICEDDGFGFDKLNNIGFVSLNVSEKGYLNIIYKVYKNGNMIVKLETKNENVEKEFLI